VPTFVTRVRTQRHVHSHGRQVGVESDPRARVTGVESNEDGDALVALDGRTAREGHGCPRLVERPRQRISRGHFVFVCATRGEAQGAVVSACMQGEIASREATSSSSALHVAPRLSPRAARLAAFAGIAACEAAFAGIAACEAAFACIAACEALARASRLRWVRSRGASS
jgi:hypothetical protein